MSLIPYAPIMVWNENYYITVEADEYGNWSVEVPVFQEYYVTGGDIDGFYESSFESEFACDSYYSYYDYYYYYYYYYYDDYDCDNSVNVHFTPNSDMVFDVHGQVTDNNGNPMVNAQVVSETAGDRVHYRRDTMYTDYMGYFHDGLPYGMYNVSFRNTGFMVEWLYDVDITSHGVFLEVSLNLAEFTGSVQGVVELTGKRLMLQSI